MIYIFLIGFIAFTVVLIYKGKNFIYILPFFNVFVDMSFFVFGYGTTTAIYRGIIYTLLFLYMVKYIRLNHNAFYFVYFLLFILFIQTITSTEFYSSVKTFFTVFYSLIPLIIGYNFIKDVNQINLFFNNLKYLIILAAVGVIVGYVFGLGKSFEYRFSGYETEGMTVGLLNSAGLFSVAVATIFIPQILANCKNNFEKVLLHASVATLFIAFLLTARRTLILLPLIGYVISFINVKKSSRIKTISVFVTSLLIIALSSPIYLEELNYRIEMREKLGRFDPSNYTDEERFIELESIFTEYLSFDQPSKVLFGFGNDIFANNIKDGVEYKRAYHTDWAKLLHGSGFVGLFIYITLLIFILVTSRKLFKTNNPTINVLSSYAVILSLILIMLGFYGTFTLFSLRLIILLFIGVIWKTVIIMSKSN